MKKKFLTVLLALTVFAGFTGCKGGGETKFIADDAEVTLNVWTVAPLIHDYKNALTRNPGDKQAQLTKWIVDEFAKLHPNITLNFTYHGWGDSLTQELNTGLNLKGNVEKNNQAPDIVVGEQYVRSYIDEDFFYPLDLGDELKADLINQADDIIVKSGKYYAVPVTTGTYGLNVNLKVLKQCGIIDAQNQPRSSWRSEMQTYINKVNAKDGRYSASSASAINPVDPVCWEDVLAINYYIRDYYDGKILVDGLPYGGSDGSVRGGFILASSTTESNWNALPFMKTAGGDFVNSAGAVTAGSDDNKLAFTMMRHIIEVMGTGGKITANEDSIAQFFKGYGAYCFQGAELVVRAYLYSTQSNPVTKDDVHVAKLPVYSSKNINSNTMVGSLYMSINRNNDTRANQSIKFIKFLLSEEVQYRFFNMDGRIPVRKSILAGEEIAEQSIYPDIQNLVEMFSNWNFKGQLYGFPRNASIIWGRWNEFVNTLFSGNAIDLNAAVNTLQANMSSAASI